MTTLGEVLDVVRVVMDTADEASSAFRAAARLAEEAAEQLHDATSGTTGLEAESVAAVTTLREGAVGLDTLAGTLDHATTAPARYVSRWTSATTEGDVDREWADGQRRGLPAYVTSGPVVDEDGHHDLVQSGAEPDGEDKRIPGHLKAAGVVPPIGSPTTARHVEVKAAWRLRDSGTRDATVVVNFPLCTGRPSCAALIPVIPLPGQTLVVHDPHRTHRFHGKAP
ncbi:hypothetical protein GCM10022243_58070 [Saccharothrix violaceirubra]